jgi:hypothetical protein
MVFDASHPSIVRRSFLVLGKCSLPFGLNLHNESM